MSGPLPVAGDESLAPAQAMPLVTVAITAYERIGLFRECLISVCQQSYRNLEIYVFDNSNSDDVQNCVLEMADDRIRYERNAHNIRNLVAINHQKAFVRRAGVYHIVLSADWALSEKAIELMAAVLASDASLCAVASDESKINLETGERGLHKSRFPSYVSESVTNSHDRLDTYRIIRDAFFTLTGLAVSYHTLMISDLLTYANFEPVYFYEAHEELAGLELLMQKPAFGLIRQRLLVDLVNDTRHQTEHFRKYRHFTQALARQRFLEKHYPVLISLGFNITLLQFGLVKLFARCVYRYPQERMFDAACRLAQVAFPLLAAACLVVLLLPLTVCQAVRKYCIRWYKRRKSKALLQPGEETKQDATAKS